MTSQSPTQLPGDKLRKAIDIFSELKKEKPDAPLNELLNEVSKKLDLSPLECDFLLRQLK